MLTCVTIVFQAYYLDAIFSNADVSRDEFLLYSRANRLIQAYDPANSFHGYIYPKSANFIN